MLVPPGAVTQTVLLAYFPLLTPTQPLTPGLQFADHAFVLEVYPWYMVYLPTRDGRAGGGGGHRQRGRPAGRRAAGPLAARARPRPLPLPGR